MTAHLHSNTPDQSGNGQPASSPNSAGNAGLSDSPPGQVGAVANPLIVNLGDEGRHEVNVSLLQYDDYQASFCNAIATAASPVIFEIRNLLEWPNEEAWHALKFIVGTGRTYMVRTGDGAAQHQTIFDAVLAMMAGHDDVTRCERGIRAAVYAAVLCHPHELRAACSRIATRAKALKIEGVTAARLHKEAETLAGATSTTAGPDNGQHVAVREIFPEADVSDEVLVPPGWILSEAGVSRAEDNGETISIPAPLILTRRFADVDGSDESVGIAWRRDNQWHEEIVPRSTIAQSREIVSLADQGAPVNSNNATVVVAYLSDFETVNLEELPRAQVTRHLGWQGENGELGFLWGRQLIRGQDAAANLIGAAAETSSHQSEVVFRGADEGDEQLVDGFRAKGTYDGWRQAVQPLAGFAKVRLSIYAALTAAMLRILGAANIINSLAGTSSQGKTITLRSAASCWGCPDETEKLTAVGTWNSTRVWTERACEILNDLPLNLDDTKRTERPQEISRTLYDVYSGRSRARGSIDGIRRVGAYHTVMISTGEAQICSFSQDGGTRARVLETFGSPFDRTDAETAAMVVAVNDAILENYGHLGPRFVQYLLNNRQHWPAWREHYRRLRARYQQRAGDNSVAGRMASAFAAIRITAILVHLALGRNMPWPYHDVVSQLWPELTSESAEADRAVAALRYVMSWARGHQKDFWTIHDGSGQVANHDWAGRWDVCSSTYGPVHPWPWVGFLEHKLDKVLEEGGFEPEPIKRVWFDREWLETSTGRRKRLRERMGAGAGLADLIAIRRSAIEELEGPLVEEAATVPFPAAARAGTGITGGNRGNREGTRNGTT